MEQQEQHELFFTGGNHSDNTPSMQPPNTYRGLKGYSLTSLTDNSYAFESEKGNSAIFVLNPKYTAIGFNVMNHKVLIHSTNDTFVPNANRKGEVGMVDISPANNLPVGGYNNGYVPLYVHKDFNYRITKQIEGWCVYENSKIQRDYWSDDFNPPRVINFALPVFTTYFTSGGSNPLVIGDSYMVLQGTIIHNGISYGPNEVDNVFTAIGTTYIGTGKVIKYVPVELFDWMPRYKMGDIRFNKWLSGGNVMCGSYQVVFQSVGLDGVTSPWSFITKPVHVSAGFPGNTITSYQNDQGGPNTTNSLKGLEFIIDGLDTNFTTIRVAAIRFTDYNIQEEPVLFYEGIITGTSMTVPFYGNENLTQLTSADIQELNVYIKRINTIVPLKNRMTGGNWDSAIDVDFDPSSARIDICEYMCPTDSIGSGLPTNGSNTSVLPFAGHKQAKAGGVSSGDILPLAWYEVTVSAINYNGILRVPGTYFQGIFGVNTYTTIGTPTIYAVIRIKKYGTTYEYTRIMDDWYDGKGSLVDNKIRSLWRFETYRAGILLRDLSGNPVYVRFIGDKKMPSQWNVAADVGPDGLPYGVDGNLIGGYDATTQETVLRHLGIEINNLNFADLLAAIRLSTGDNTLQYSDFPKYFSGFEIVRVSRDKQVFAQGIMGAVMDNASAPDRYPMAQFNVSLNGGARVPQLYTLYSPDYLFEFSGDSPQEGDWLRIEEYRVKNEDFISNGFFTNNCRKYPINVPNATTGTVLNPIPGSAWSPKGYMVPIIPERSAPVDPNVDYVDTGSTTFHNYSISSTTFYGIGARTYFFSQNYAEGVANLFHGFGNWQAGIDRPPIVSVVRPKNILYGGTSDSAKANNLYEFCGHYQQFDVAFLAYLQANAGIASGIQVFGGDCFISYFDLARNMDDSNNTYGPNTWGLTSIFPVESNVNTYLREGRHPAKDGPSSSNPAGTGLVYPNLVEQWVYNKAYSSDELFYTEPALPVNFIPNNQLVAQAIYSNAKFPGEFTDAYRKFQPANKRDLEGVLGAIINMVVKKGALYAFQENGISYLPVEERASVPVGLNAPMIIGTGGVMPRYDNTDNYYGNQHQFGLCETPNGFVWFDGNRKAFCYLEGGLAQPLSVIKGRDAFFQNNVYGTILENDAPVWGIGIASIYDARMKRVFMVFKDNTRNGYEFGIYFDIKNKQFLGESNHFPAIMFNLMEHLYSAFEGISQNAFLANHTYAVGDVVGVGSENYVCILGYTTLGFPLQPSLDATHWALASVANQIFLDNTNDIGKFYGLVRDEEMTVCFNPAHGTAKFFNNLEFTGNNVFFDDVEVSNNTQTGADTNIVLGPDKDYWFYNNKHFGSIPMTSLGERLKDVFLVARFVKKNKLNNSPINSKNKTLRLSSIKTLFTKAP